MTQFISLGDAIINVEKINFIKKTSLSGYAGIAIEVEGKEEALEFYYGMNMGGADTRDKDFKNLQKILSPE